MNDELERLRREVERLTAERDRARSEMETLKLGYRDALIRLSMKEWEGITPADLDAARNSGVPLQHYIDRLRGSASAA